MGGRLDAVNVVDPDFALITTIGLDHQQFLGDTVEEIAAEKAGILRAGRPGFYGDWPVPRAIRRVASERGAELRCLGERFDFTPSGPCWSWRGQQLVLDNLSYPSTASLAQLRNTSLALAAIEQFEASLIADAAVVNGVIAEATPPGRFQVFRRDHEWILDVAHNPQAATTLRAQLDRLEAATETTVVLGMLGDKSLEEFIAPLRQVVCRWVVCTVDDQRACPAGEIAARMRNGGIAGVLEAATPDQGLALARDRTAAGGRIIVCGSFRMVGPALWWLGIY
jgi:dihydrofolate synthase/folylpolyglutamate synthase